MQLPLRSIFAAVCLLGLAATPPVSAQIPEAPKKSSVIAGGARLIPAAEVKAMHLGNTVYFVSLTTKYGSRGVVASVFVRDERTWVANSGGGKKYEMVWWMDGDAVCNEAPNRSAIGCSVLYDLEGMIYTCNTAEDICRFVVRFLPGNPENL